MNWIEYNKKCPKGLRHFPERNVEALHSLAPQIPTENALPHAQRVAHDGQHNERTVLSHDAPIS
jgi:hypothetical protein